jgi:hypothetical protein
MMAKYEETFDDYEDFSRRRGDVEDDNKYAVDSYCDTRLKIFRLIYRSNLKVSTTEEQGG